MSLESRLVAVVLSRNRKKQLRGALGRQWQHFRRLRFWFSLPTSPSLSRLREKTLLSEVTDNSTDREGIASSMSSTGGEKNDLRVVILGYYISSVLIGSLNRGYMLLLNFNLS